MNRMAATAFAVLLFSACKPECPPPPICKCEAPRDYGAEYDPFLNRLAQRAGYSKGELLTDMRAGAAKANVSLGVYVLTARDILWASLDRAKGTPEEFRDFAASLPVEFNSQHLKPTDVLPPLPGR